MKKNTKQLLLVGGLAVGGYFAYQWYQERQLTDAEAAAYYPGGYGAGGGLGGGGFGASLWGGGTCGPLNEAVPEEGMEMPLSAVPPFSTPEQWTPFAYEEARREQELAGLREPVGERAATLWDRIRLGAVTRGISKAQAAESHIAMQALGQAQVAAYRDWKAVEAATPRGDAYTIGLQPYRGLTGYPRSVSTPQMEIVRKEAAKGRLAFQMKRGLGASTLPVGESLAAKRTAGLVTRAAAQTAATAAATRVTAQTQARVAEYQAAARRAPTAYSRVQPTVGLTAGYSRPVPVVAPEVVKQISEYRAVAAMRNI